MSIALTVAEIRHERRVRLFFTIALGGGAFTSTSFYSVSNLNGSGTTPDVVAAYPIVGATACVELQLDADLTQGSAYSFSAVGVPGVDSSTTPDPSTAFATFGSKIAPIVTTSGSDLDALLYGEDVLFDGTEFSEDPSGDLAGISGPPNLRLALLRRGLSDGLPWDGTYGIGTRSYIDGTPGAMPSLRAQAESQMRLDDRVAQVTATVDVGSDDTNDANTGYLTIDATPIGTDTALASIPVPVKLF